MKIFTPRNLLFGALSLLALVGCNTTPVTGGGSGSISFSNASGFNGSAAVYTPSSAAGAATGLSTGQNSNPVRSLNIMAPTGFPAEGTTVAPSSTLIVMYQEAGTNQQLRGWQSNTSGSIRVVKNSGGKFSFELTNVVVTAPNEPNNTGTGSVTLNGTIGN